VGGDVRTTVAAGLLAIALVLPGCDDDPSEPSAQPSSTASVAKATGPKVKGHGYTFRAPKGWTVPPSSPAGVQVDSFAGEPASATKQYSNNVNVLVLDAPKKMSIDDLEEQSEAELKATGAAVIRVLHRSSVGRSKAIHLTSTNQFNTRTIKTEQFIVLRSGSLYVVTFSLAPAVPKAERERIAASVVATWRWTEPATRAA
jgi:hypothetical protein